MRSCEGCRYWSELIAEAIGGGPIKAMCLHPDGGQKMVYRGCEKYEAGTPIDLCCGQDLFAWTEES